MQYALSKSGAIGRAAVGQFRDGRLSSGSLLGIVQSFVSGGRLAPIDISLLLNVTSRMSRTVTEDSNGLLVNRSEITQCTRLLSDSFLSSIKTKPFTDQMLPIDTALSVHAISTLQEFGGQSDQILEAMSAHVVKSVGQFDLEHLCQISIAYRPGRKAGRSVNETSRSRRDGSGSISRVDVMAAVLKEACSEGKLRLLRGCHLRTLIPSCASVLETTESSTSGVDFGVNCGRVARLLARASLLLTSQPSTAELQVSGNLDSLTVSDFARFVDISLRHRVIPEEMVDAFISKIVPLVGKSRSSVEGCAISTEAWHSLAPRAAASCARMIVSGLLQHTSESAHYPLVRNLIAQSVADEATFSEVSVGFAWRSLMDRSTCISALLDLEVSLDPKMSDLDIGQAEKHISMVANAMSASDIRFPETDIRTVADCLVSTLLLSKRLSSVRKYSDTGIGTDSPTSDLDSRLEDLALEFFSVNARFLHLDILEQASLILPATSIRGRLIRAEVKLRMKSFKEPTSGDSRKGPGSKGA